MARIENKYYIIEPPYTNIQDIIRVCVGKVEDQIASNDKTKLIVKLPIGDNGDYPFMAHLKSHTHAEISQVLLTPEWA